MQRILTPPKSRTKILYQQVVDSYTQDQNFPRLAKQEYRLSVVDSYTQCPNY